MLGFKVKKHFWNTSQPCVPPTEVLRRRDAEDRVIKGNSHLSLEHKELCVFLVPEGAKGISHISPGFQELAIWLEDEKHQSRRDREKKKTYHRIGQRKERFLTAV